MTMTEVIMTSISIVAGSGGLIAMILGFISNKKKMSKETIEDNVKTAAALRDTAMDEYKKARSELEACRTRLDAISAQLWSAEANYRKSEVELDIAMKEVEKLTKINKQLHNDITDKDQEIERQENVIRDQGKIIKDLRGRLNEV